jgi:hypothetical protein
LTDEEIDDFPDSTPDESWAGRRDDVTLLAPIVGGCDQPFEPTEKDWADYRAWCESVDRLDAFNEDRLDRSSR